MNKYQKLESKIYKSVKKTVCQSIASGCMIFNHKDYLYVNSNKGRRNYLIDQRKDIKKVAKLYNQSVYEVMQGELTFWKKVGDNMSKYKSKKIQIDGITFDSKDEANYYLYLKDKKAKGEIRDFGLQQKFELIPKFEKDGKKYRAMTYTPDFVIFHNDGTEEYIDVKGFSTQQGEMRKKLFDYFYRDKKLTWISINFKYGNEDGLIEYKELQDKRKEAKKAKKAM